MKHFTPVRQELRRQDEAARVDRMYGAPIPETCPLCHDMGLVGPNFSEICVCVKQGEKE